MTETKMWTNSIFFRENDQHGQKINRFFVLKDGGQWCVAYFDNMQQLKNWAKTIGFEFRLTDEWDDCIYGHCQSYECDRLFQDKSVLFWSKDAVPANATPIKALSNGSIVDCYFVNDGQNVTLYRPNPNAHGVYTPLSLHEHIAHVRQYGTY